jgi:hypothetical protein
MAALRRSARAERPTMQESSFRDDFLRSRSGFFARRFEGGETPRRASQKTGPTVPPTMAEVGITKRQCSRRVRHRGWCAPRRPRRCARERRVDPVHELSASGIQTLTREPQPASTTTRSLHRLPDRGTRPTNRGARAPRTRLIAYPRERPCQPRGACRGGPFGASEAPDGARGSGSVWKGPGKCL